MEGLLYACSNPAAITCENTKREMQPKIVCALEAG
jgi:hypothetical protein